MHGIDNMKTEVSLLCTMLLKYNSGNEIYHYIMRHQIVNWIYCNFVRATQLNGFRGKKSGQIHGGSVVLT